MQCIDLSEIVHVVKDDTVLTLFVVSHFLSAKVTPEWRLNLGFAFLK